MVIGVVGLVPQVPGEDAPIFPEPADKAAHVTFQHREPPRIPQHRDARALHPTGVVHAGLGLALPAGVREGMPYAVEDHGDHAEAVARGEAEEDLDAIEQTRRIFGEDEVVQVNSERVEA